MPTCNDSPIRRMIYCIVTRTSLSPSLPLSVRAYLLPFEVCLHGPPGSWSRNSLVATHLHFIISLRPVVHFTAICRNKGKCADHPNSPWVFRLIVQIIDDRGSMTGGTPGVGKTAKPHRYPSNGGGCRVSLWTQFLKLGLCIVLTTAQNVKEIHIIIRGGRTDVPTAE